MDQKTASRINETLDEMLSLFSYLVEIVDKNYSHDKEFETVIEHVSSSMKGIVELQGFILKLHPEIESYTDDDCSSYDVEEK